MLKQLLSKKALSSSQLKLVATTRGFATGAVSKAQALEEGEYIEDGSKRHACYKNGTVLNKIDSATLKDQSAQVNTNFEKFAEKFGIKVPTHKTEAPRRSGVADLMKEYSQFADELLEEQKAKNQKVYITGAATPHSQEVQQAVDALEKLKKVLDPSSAIVQVSIEDIEKSFTLRQSLIEECSQNHHILSAKKSSSFEKQYDSPIAERVDRNQSLVQSDAHKQAKRSEEVIKHNVVLRNEYVEGEEGIDYVLSEEGDQRIINPKKIEKSIRAEINAIKIRSPAVGKYYEDFLLKRNAVDEGMELDVDISKIVKYYPGGPNGPEPEDNPGHYSEWFFRNQPADLIYGKDKNTTYKDIGVKWKWIWQKKAMDDDAMTVEYQDDVTNFLERDELYPMQNFEGIAEWDIADLKSFDQNQPGKLPHLRFHTHIKEDELLPIPDIHTLDYSKIMWELERWTLFKSLPSMVAYNNNMSNILKGVQNGSIKVPDYVNDINPPSLLAYYSTLPSWARKDPIVRNVFMAMEYHKPGLDIRNKEQALNLACSFLRPIDTTMKEVLTIAITSQKVQMTMKKGTQLLNDIQFHELDEQWLGSESDDGDGEDGDNDDDVQSIIQMNQNNEDEEMTPMQAALRVLDEDFRKEDMRQSAETEMSINEYKVEPATNQAMTDFFEFDHAGPDDIPAYSQGDKNFGVPAEELPLNYYDNDDGYWDDYISRKMKRHQDAGMITNRMYFIH